MAAAALCRPGNMDPTGVVTGAVTSFGSSLLIIIGVNGLRKKRSPDVVFLPPGINGDPPHHLDLNNNIFDSRAKLDILKDL